jgi:hypothetical protein
MWPMELIERSHRDGFMVAENGNHDALLHDKYERALKQTIIDEAKLIGADWIEATKGKSTITKDEYQRLFEAGYSSYSPDEVLGLFESWNDVHEASQLYYEERLAERLAKEEVLLHEMQDDYKNGLLPIDLFLDTVDWYEESSSRSRGALRKQIIGIPAPKEKLLKRYATYKTTESLRFIRAESKELTEERKLSIALGFTIKTNKSLSSFIGTIKNSFPGISDEEIFETVEKLGEPI